ncbi:MAG: nuclear transport factor 2 family protein, partial [Tunicatimonas sp.]
NLIWLFAILPTTTASLEAVVQMQLEAYNARDIDAFMDTYADSIAIYEFPNTLIMKGKQDLRDTYTKLFNEVTNLRAEIKHRVVLDNRVIDHEYVRFGGKYIDAVAIYEVAEGKITRVTFVQKANSD